MIATRAGVRARAPLCAGLAVSAVLHAGVLAVLALVPAGLVAPDCRPADASAPLTVAWAQADDDARCVIVSAAPLVTCEVPPPQAVDAPDSQSLAVAEPPDVVPAAQEAPPPAAEGGPAAAGLSRLAELAGLRPARGRAGRSTFGGGGGDSDGAGGVGDRDGLSGALAGIGAGGGGPGSGWAARGGETRGPAVVGALAAPPYPAKARSRGWEGRVILLLTIDEDGRVTSAEVAESSGRPALDDAACDAALGWTLSPALHDGEPVPGTLRVPVRFALTD